MCIIIENRQHDNLNSLVKCTDSPDRFNPVYEGHIDIHQDHIRHQLFNLHNNPGTVRITGTYLVIPCKRKEIAKALPQINIVFVYKDSDRHVKYNYGLQLNAVP